MRILLACVFGVMSSSALAGEVRLPEDQIEAGEALYLKKCRQCHGKDALGGNAPDIQGILLQDVLNASEGVENMPKIPLQVTEAAQIAVYLMSLSPDQACVRLGLE